MYQWLHKILKHKMLTDRQIDHFSSIFGPPSTRTCNILLLHWKNAISPKPTKKIDQNQLHFLVATKFHQVVNHLVIFHLKKRPSFQFLSPIPGCFPPHTMESCNQPRDFLDTGSSLLTPDHQPSLFQNLTKKYDHVT